MGTQKLKRKLWQKPTDHCVLCGKDTGIPKDEHVNNRRNYVEGAGQLCPECYGGTYQMCY